MTSDPLIDTKTDSEASIQNPNTLRRSLFGYLLYHSLTKRKKIVLENINTVYQNKLSELEKKQLALALFSHIARTVKESYLLHRGKKKFQPSIEIRGLEHLTQAIQRGKGVIILGAHAGSWELCILRAYEKNQLLQNNLYVLRRKKPPFLQKILDKHYTKIGINIIEKTGAIQTACTILKNKGILLFAFDQHVTPHKKQGISVPFFEKKTGCNRSLAVLAMRTGAAVVPLNQYRIGSNQHVLELHPALPWIDSSNKKQALYKNTLQYNKTLEKFILQNPEQWWGWVYRHWHS